LKIGLGEKDGNNSLREERIMALGAKGEKDGVVGGGREMQLLEKKGDVYKGKKGNEKSIQTLSSSRRRKRVKWAHDEEHKFKHGKNLGLGTNGGSDVGVLRKNGESWKCLNTQTEQSLNTTFKSKARDHREDSVREEGGDHVKRRRRHLRKRQEEGVKEGRKSLEEKPFGVY